MARRVHHRGDIARLARRALSEGGKVVRRGVVHWDVSGGCASPFRVSFEGKPVKWGTDPHSPFAFAEDVIYGDCLDQATIYVDMDTPCRKCPACLKRRAAHWRYRAKAEIQRAPRTWFGTLTLSPQSHYLMGLRASRRLGRNISELSQEEQFKERHKEASREITLWLKRIREESEAPLRYVVVAEAHQSGLPHYHVLVHERSPHLPVGERTLRKQWSMLGHAKFNLVEGSHAANYVCKYLSKAALARVRASVRYGKETLLEYRVDMKSIRF